LWGLALPDIFLSYSREDQAVAKRFADGFGHAGFSVWWDQTLNPGEAYDRVTEKALREAKAVAVLWSKKSVDSHWVRAEATQAHSNGTLVPVMIEPCTRPIMFELTHTVDLSHWKGDLNDKDWQSYVAGVRRFVDKDASVAAVRSPVPARARPLSMRAIAIAVVALLVAGAGIWMFSHKSAERAASVTAAAAPAVAEVTLAVLPFANLSSDPEQEYFSDGLTEELLNQLAQVKALRVTGRTSSFSFKGKNEDLREIGRKLGVANLLEGSVRKEGRNLRITAQLIQARDGTHLWSKTYDHELSGVFALQEEIAKDVTKALSITLDVGDLPRAKGGTTNVEAYDKYLRATGTAGVGGRADLLQTVQLLREVVAMDPTFIQAWFELNGLLGPLASRMPENAVAIRQEQLAVTARIETLPLDEQLARRFHAAQSWEKRKWADAVAAIAQPGPDNYSIALILRSVGRNSDAVPHLQRLVQTDPLVLAYSAELQLALYALGRIAEGNAEFKRGATLSGDANDKDYAELINMWVNKDVDPKVGKARLKTFLQQAGNGYPHGFATLADKLDDDKVVRAALHQVFDDPANQIWLFMLPIAQLADHLGDKDLALAAIRRAFVDMHSAWAPALWAYYETDLRADPRFKDILREIGLADYFRSSGNWGDYCKPVGANDFECH
jgi:TolB-like protein